MNAEENLATETGLVMPAPADPPAEAKPKKKRGRPTNAERAARAAVKAVAEGEKVNENKSEKSVATEKVAASAEKTNDTSVQAIPEERAKHANSLKVVESATATDVQPAAPTPAGDDKTAAAPRSAEQSADSQPAQFSNVPPSPHNAQQPLSMRQLKRRQWFERRNKMRGQQNVQGNRRPLEPSAQQQVFQPPESVVPRNPSLPEYKLADIHSWDNATIVEKMWPDANAEELGAMKRHEIIFHAIRRYLNHGGAVLASGCLEVVKEGYGFLRSAKTNFLACPEDVFIPQQQIRRHALRTGDTIEGPIRDPRDRDRFFALGNVLTVNGKTPSEAARIVHFENLTPTFPTRRIVLETVPGELSTRIVDIFTPIGFGQRGLIVAPPRVGKTVLLQKIANAITANHPDAILIVLLIDERPEEVTDMQRNTKAIVLSSTFDEEPHHHVNVAEMTGEMARRQVENGKDVIILLDSITRLARAYNTVQPHSGKILTGGVDALALHRPKRFFGAARNIEHGGSLTILATALIDTGSRMDEVIFEEFKGTGNMELVLDRGLADKRIFPAIDIEKSGTRKEDLLLDPLEREKTWALRRILADAGPEQAMIAVLNKMRKVRTNPEFLLSLDLKNL